MQHGGGVQPIVEHVVRTYGGCVIVGLMALEWMFEWQRERGLVFRPEQFQPIAPGIAGVEAPIAGQICIPGDRDACCL